MSKTLKSLTDAELFELWSDLRIPDGSDLLATIDAERFARMSNQTGETK